MWKLPVYLSKEYKKVRAERTVNISDLITTKLFRNQQEVISCTEF